MLTTREFWAGVEVINYKALCKDTSASRIQGFFNGQVITCTRNKYVLVTSKLSLSVFMGEVCVSRVCVCV